MWNDHPDRTPTSLPGGQARADIVVNGDVTGERIEQLRHDISNALARGARRLIVDVSRVGCFQAAGYEILLDAAGRLSDQGGWLKLLNGSTFRRLVGVDVVDLTEPCRPEGGEPCEIEKDLICV